RATCDSHRATATGTSGTGGVSARPCGSEPSRAWRPCSSFRGATSWSSSEAWLSRPQPTSGRSYGSSSTPRADLCERERLARDAVLLHQVRGGVALRGARAPRPADEAHLDARGGLLEAMAGRAPGAHVLRLLLRPHDLVERRVRRQQL